MRRPRRVLALVTDAFGARGGIAQYNRDFLTALAGLPGVERIDVLARLGDPSGELSMAIHQAAPSFSRATYALGALWRALRGRPGVVFCGHLHLAPLALLAARLAKAKLVVQTHGVEVWRRPSRLQRLALERADLVLAVSRDTRAKVLAGSALAPERVAVIPNTVSEAFGPGDGEDVRNRLDLTGRQVLLCLGRLDARERYKGHDRVIGLIEPLAAAGHDVVFLIAGEGDDRTRLSDLARRHGVESRVRFLGAVQDAERAGLYRAADLYVMPSTGEGFGIAFVEAMACGTPAVGLAVGGARDALGDGELGGLVQEDRLLEAIDQRLRAPRSDRESLAARVNARFGPQVFRRRVAEVAEAFL